MTSTLHTKAVEVKQLALRRFVKRPWGLDGTQKFDSMTRTQTAVLLTMIDLISEDLEDCYYSHDSIAKRAHCARRTVVTALHKLRDLGYIEWVSRGVRMNPKTNRPMNLTNRYFLTEKLLHALPYDVLTGELRNVAEEEKIRPVLQPICVQKEHRNSREYSIKEYTLAAANAACQTASQDFEDKGKDTEEGRGGSGLDLGISEPKLVLVGLKNRKAKKDTSLREVRPSPQFRSPPSKAVDPLLRDQAIEIIQEYRKHRAKYKSLPDDNLFFTHQYEQIGLLIELVGSRENAIYYLKYVTDNWKDLIGSTGVRDAEKLLSYPNLNQALAHWRVKIWWKRSLGIQSDRTLKRRAKVKAAVEKFQADRKKLDQDVAMLKLMLEGKMPFDASRFGQTTVLIQKPAQASSETAMKFGNWFKQKT